MSRYEKERIAFEAKSIPAKYDYLAPDRSEIRELIRTNSGNLAHCILPPQAVSSAVSHKTVEEMWFFLSGRGQLWRKQGKRESVVDVGPGVALSIPVGTHFQFRNTGWDSLEIIITTMPPWPGKEEAIQVQGYWKSVK